MQTTTVNLLFCFSFLYKNTSACYTSDWKKKKRNSKSLSACWFEKNNVDRFVGTIYMAYSHMAYIHMGKKTRTKGQFSHGKLPSLHLFKLRGKGTAGLTAGPGRQRTGTELNGRVSGLFWGKGWNGLRIAGIYKCLTPTIAVGWSLVMKSEEACTLWWYDRLLQSLGKESRKERKLCIWGFRGTCELATPLWVSGSEVITQICSPLKLKGEKKPKP